MVRLFLCEDEIVMRDGIKNHIDWEKEGIEFVGEASDGELAYPMILESKPDILITDIKMPFMDGLELSELVKKELPNIRIIILSGYDEFTYAQRAVSLGVTEYLLKPISPGKLRESIRLVAEKIEEERDLIRAEEEWAKAEQEERIAIEKGRLFEALIMNNMSTSEVLDKAKELEISLTARTYRMVLISIALTGASADSFSESRNRLKDEIITAYETDADCIIFDRGLNGFAVLVMADDRSGSEELTKENIRILQETMERYEDIEYFIGVGETVNRLSEIRNSYYEATRAVANRFLVENDTEKVVFAISIDEDDKENKSSGNKVPERLKLNIEPVIDSESPHKAIENFLRTGSSVEAEPLLDSIFLAIGEQNANSLIFLNYLTMDIYLAMARFVKEIGADSEEIDKECGDINDLIVSSMNSEEIKAYLKKYLLKVIEVRDSSSAKKYSRLLSSALSYIDECYANEDISLNKVASNVNISPNHFSTIFSQEMGKTFIEYLINKRMDKAKELLMTTDMRSSEIAYAVGYKDPHYFSYTFKKTQGMTTREFRSRGRSTGEGK
ncbi:MAG: response regulator [Lachnospiraceae bacterium]|nr:response regulator [Lachnospiraceae bacterium]